MGLLAYDPLAARYERHDLGRHEAADEGRGGDGRYCGDCGQRQRALEYPDPKSEPQDMHQVDAVTEFRHRGYCLGGSLAFYAGEEQECAYGERHAVDGAHGPADLYDGRLVRDARHGLYVEREYCRDGAGCHEYEPRNETAALVPLEVLVYVVRYDRISEVSREVPQHVVFVPEAFAPQFAAPAVQVWHAGRDEEEDYEEAFLAGCSAFEPRRDYGYEEIDAYERVHEP